MILNVEQRQGFMIISYINRKGNVSYKKIKIPANQQYVYIEAKNKWIYECPLCD